MNFNCKILYVYEEKWKINVNQALQTAMYSRVPNGSTGKSPAMAPRPPQHK